jgi:ubiquitin C-terminal hydrolase
MIELPIYDLAQRKRYSTYNTYSTLDINEVLSSYFSESKIDGAKCECGEDIYSKTSIFKLPKILIVFFGRTVNGQYISNKISYSEILDLKNYLYDKSISNDYKYSLSGVIHYISFGKKLGHYTASCQCDDGWYYFDDSRVTKVQNLYPNEIILFYENKS